MSQPLPHPPADVDAWRHRPVRRPGGRTGIRRSALSAAVATCLWLPVAQGADGPSRVFDGPGYPLAETPSELVLIDTRVPEYQRIVEALPAGAEVVLVDSRRDGHTQIDTALRGRMGLQAIRIVSHGEAGRLLLGAEPIDRHAVEARAGTWRRIGAALREGGDVLLYGCDVAAGGQGQRFVRRLAALTGRDVAASSNRTGRDGDWELEIRSGDIEALPRLAVTADYPHALATLTVTSNADSGAGSLRNAISSASPGDTITFNAGMTITLTSGQLSINKNLTIDGDLDNNGTPDVTLDANHNSRVLAMTAGTVALDGLVITNGLVFGNGGDYNSVPGKDALGGGIHVSGGVLTIRNAHITANKAAGGGGNGGGAGYGYGGGGGGGFSGKGGGNGGAYAAANPGGAGGGGVGGNGGNYGALAQAGKGGSTSGGAGGSAVSGFAAGGNGGTAGSGGIGFIGGGGAGAGASGASSVGRGGSAAGGMYIAAGATVYMSSSTVSSNLGAGGGGAGSSYTVSAANGGDGVGGILNRGSLFYENGTVSRSNNFGTGGAGGGSQNGQAAGFAGSGSNTGNETFLTLGAGTTDATWSPNTTPSLSSLNGDSVGWAGVGNSVSLDAGGNGDTADAELDALNSGNGNWSGASLSVQRSGTAISSDTFGFNTSGAPFTVSGSNLQSGGLTFASFTNSGGVLSISFTSSGTAATSALVDSVLQRITYRNDTPAGDAVIRFTLSDGSASTSADVTVTSDTIFVTNSTDTSTINISNGVSFSEAVAIAAADATGSQTVAFAGTLASTALTINSVSLTESLSFDIDAASGMSLSSGTLTLGAGTTQSFSNGTGDTATISSVIAGSGALTKAGAGGLTMSATNTYSGATTVSAGTLTVSGGDAIAGSSSVSVASGATLALSGNEAIGNLAGAGAITLGSHTLTTTVTANTTFSGSISGTGGVTVNQTGAATFALTLSGNNSYSGSTTTINFGSLRLDGDAAVSSSSLLRANGNSVITLLTDQAVGSLASNSASASINLGSFTLSAGGDNTSTTVSGVIAGSGNLVKQGSGTLTLGGSNSYGGSTTVSTGTLAVSSDGNLGSGTITLAGGTLGVTAASTIDNAIQLDATSTVEASAATTLSGTIAGTGGLIKSGASNLTLAGNNTYTGTTTVSAGALVVTGSTAGATTVSAGTLAGGGTLGGTVTVSSGATLSPGLSPGSMTINGDLAMAAGSTLAIELAGTTAGSGFDQLVVNGSVSLGGATLSTTHSHTAAPGDVYAIIANDGSEAVTGTFSGLAQGAALVAGGNSTPLTVSYTGASGNDVVLAAQFNSPPTDISLSASSINASVSAAAAVVGTLDSSDIDAGDSHTYSLVAAGASAGGNCGAAGDDHNAAFQIDNPNAELETAGPLAAGSYNVCVQSSDGSATFQKTFAITVLDDIGPTATLVVADSELLSGETSLLTITFSEAVSGFTNGDLTVPNGALSPVASGDGGVTWTATFTPDAGINAPSNVITIDNTGVEDASGNAGAGTTDSNVFAIRTAAQSLLVTSNADSGTDASTAASLAADSADGSGLSIREALFWVRPGDTIGFDLDGATAGAQGGTIILDGSELVVGYGNVLIDGDLDGDGGADVTISGNDSTRVMQIDTGLAGVELSGLTLTQGRGSSGGGLFIGINTSVTVRNCHISNNVESGLGGGGVFGSSASLTMIGSTVSGNTSNSFGGGIRLVGNGTLNLVSSTVSGNTTTGTGAHGGGIQLASGAGGSTIVNSTISGNAVLGASSLGGGLRSTAGPVSVHSSTIVGNAASSGAGGLSANGTETIVNSVVAGNTSGVGATAAAAGAPLATGGTADDVGGTIETATHSYFGTTATITTNSGSLNSQGTASLLLDDLVQSGIRPATHAPQAGSALIDAGSNAALPADLFDVDGDNNTAETLPLDANGNTRVVGTVNIGAVENLDMTAPTTLGIVVADTSLIVGETSLVTITFSEAVTGFTNADLTVDNGTPSSVSSSDGGITWTATLTPTAGIADPTNTITLDNSGVSDLAGNAGSGTATSNNYAIDTQRPTASITVADTSLSQGETSLVTFTFSEVVTGFTNADLTVANGTLSSVNSSDGGITWTATLTPAANTSAPSNQIVLANTGITDVAGNAGSGTTVSNSYAVQTTTATTTVVVADSSLIIGETSPVTITFSEAVSGLDVSDFTVANGSLGAPTSTNGGVTWTSTLTPAANVEATGNLISLANSGVTTVAGGNPGTGTSVSNAYAVDTRRPTAVIVVADATLTAGETSAVSITFSEAVSGFGNSDLTVPNGTLSAVSSSDGGLTWSATLTPAAGTTAPGNVITLANAGVNDLAGNPGAGTTTSAPYAVRTGSFTVGGQVAGLSGSGLVLRNNGADDLAVAANGSFVFATPVADAAAYLVSVATQPTSPEQNCTVTRGSGSITSANVVDVQIDCVLSSNLPSAPRNISGTPGDRQITVQWQAPQFDGGSPITGYLAQAVPQGVGAKGAASCSTTGALSCVVTGLNNGTAYTLQVSASNANGSGAAGSGATAVTPLGVPGAPGNVQVQVSGNQATVSWTPPATTGGAPITSYTVTSSPGGLGCTVTGSPPPNSCQIAGLQPGVSYTFTVVARNAAGAGAGSVGGAPAVSAVPLVIPVGAPWALGVLACLLLLLARRQLVPPPPGGRTR